MKLSAGLRFWSKSLTIQFIVLMMLALGVSQAVGMLIFWGERGDALQQAARNEFIGRSASIAHVLESTPQNVQSDILRASGTTYSRFWVTPKAPGPAEVWRREAFNQLARPLPSIENLDDPPKFAMELRNDPRLVAPPYDGAAHDWRELLAGAWPLDRPAKVLRLNDANGMGLSVRLNDGSWLNTALAKPVMNAFWTPQSIVSLAVAALLLGLIAAFLARGVTRPMRRMAAAAEALGRGERAVLPETGPDDIRATAEAFNLMQARVERFIDDRTRMLAAMGHDLRTPITSLRLRAEFVTDDETRAKMLSTIDELRSIAEASLAFAREEAETEDVRSVDLNALVESLCDDLQEIGYDVAFVGPERVKLRCRPDGLRRAVRNIIENAVRYGVRGRVTIVERGADSVEIVVEDDGPGIPEDAMEQVFAPFFRLERSRNRETGGIGLGLAIARTIARRHGGDVLLENRSGGGLTVRVSLPVSARQPNETARNPRWRWTTQPQQRPSSAV
jgi:signal transduction histidine kinase